MGLRKWFGSDKEQETESYEDYTLSSMKVGFLVDYDLHTWQVSRYCEYDFDDYTTQEWELRQGQDGAFLERSEEGGEPELSFTRRIPLNEIEEDVHFAVAETDDPPKRLTFANRTYEAIERSAGLMRENGMGEGREFVSWSYASENERLLFIAQWGENEFAAYEGEQAKEYQFTDILPGSDGQSDA